MLTTKYALNFLNITVVGKEAVAILNGVLLEDKNGDIFFDVGSETSSGNTLVRGAGMDGTITHYDQLTVSRFVPNDLVADRQEAMEISRESSKQSMSKDISIDELEHAVPDP